MEDDTAAILFSTAVALGITTLVLGNNTINNYTFKQADLNGDGIKQEMIASKGDKQIAYFPDTNGNYVVRENFDFNSLTSLEAKVEAKN